MLNQNGLEYTADNIDALMLQRHENKKLLRAGMHPKGAAKRTKEQDIRFCDALERILSGTSGNQPTECDIWHMLCVKKLHTAIKSLWG